MGAPCGDIILRFQNDSARRGGIARVSDLPLLGAHTILVAEAGEVGLVQAQMGVEESEANKESRLLVSRVARSGT
jgi:hypothetical protein